MTSYRATDVLVAALFGLHCLMAGCTGSQDHNGRMPAATHPGSTVATAESKEPVVAPDDGAMLREHGLVYSLGGALVRASGYSSAVLRDWADGREHVSHPFPFTPAEAPTETQSEGSGFAPGPRHWIDAAGEDRLLLLSRDFPQVQFDLYAEVEKLNGGLNLSAEVQADAQRAGVPIRMRQAPGRSLGPRAASIEGALYLLLYADPTTWEDPLQVQQQLGYRLNPVLAPYFAEDEQVSWYRLTREADNWLFALWKTSTEEFVIYGQHGKRTRQDGDPFHITKVGILPLHEATELLGPRELWVADYWPRLLGVEERVTARNVEQPQGNPSVSGMPD